mmetsp:Transcript_5415/g.13909  ORF Transcript_5415/g.13909 Transcript_5415/m.13909 type:complete len:308 (+) Transcript_5415:243-1166(+)
MKRAGDERSARRGCDERRAISQRHRGVLGRKRPPAAKECRGTILTSGSRLGLLFGRAVGCLDGLRRWAAVGGGDGEDIILSGGGRGRRRQDGGDVGACDVLFGFRARHPGRDDVGGLGLDVDANIDKAGIGEHTTHFVVGRRPRNSAAVAVLALEVFGKFVLPEDVGDGDAASGFEDPGHFPVDLGLVGAEVNDAVADDAVDDVVADGEVLDLAEAEAHDVRQVGGLLGEGLAVQAPGLLEHLRGHVDADDPALGTHGPGGEEAVDAGARAQVDDDVPLAELGHRQGISAAQTEVRALGDLRRAVVS